MRARSALFTLFGDVVRPAGGEAWLAVLTACTGTLGFTPEATRTALHRMGVEGWVEPRRVGRYAAYRLTARGVDRLEEAAARIYRLRAADWDGRWRVLVLPDGTAGAATVRELGWRGFGELQRGVWISPHPHGDRIAGLVDGVGGGGAVRLVAERGADDPAIVRRAWDLTGLRQAHEAFLAAWRDAPAPEDDREAFAQRLRLVHHWRSFLFLDPGLPGALLPADWLGDDAARCFAERYDALDEAAWRFYTDLVAAAAPQDGAPLSLQPGDSPFARGLAALSRTAAGGTS